ncbi:MAG: hypothetical protein LUD03_06380 [Firmicutes bacterium]|nr:hypothetical protein [Bacillota bacterium]
MLFEIIFAAASLWCVIRLATLSRVCVLDRNFAGAVMLIAVCIILAAFSIFGFMDL